MKQTWSCKDVEWHSNKYKRAIAYSTIATSDYITMINQPNMCAKNLLAEIKSGKYIVDCDAEKVLQAFIDKGLEDELILTREQ